MAYNPVRNKLKGKWYNRKYSDWKIADYDIQKQKLYATEYIFFEKERFAKHLKTKEAAIKFIENLIEKPEFIKRFGKYVLDEESISIRKSKHSTVSEAHIYDTNYIHIVFSRVYAPEYIALHELAHCICPSVEGHGALFCRVYSDLIGIHYGDEKKEKFKDLLKEMGVEYKPI